MLTTTITHTGIYVQQAADTALRRFDVLKRLRRVAGAMIMMSAGFCAHAAVGATAVSSDQASASPPVADALQAGTRREVVIDGLTVHYQDIGDPNAETIVFIHGAGGILSTGRVGPLLAQRYRVLMPSLPGFDDTQRGKNQTLADVAEVVARFIKTVTKPPVYVAGQSLGGRTASWLAIEHPELVRKLVLSAPATLASKPPQLPDDDEAARKLLARMLLGDENAGARFTPQQMAGQRETMKLLADYMRVPSRDMFLERLGEITAPTLLVWGTKDAALFAEGGPEMFAERIKHLRVQFLNGPHGLPMTNGPELAEHTLAFLAANEQVSRSGVVNPGAFSLRSAAFEDSGMMAKKYAGAAKGNPACDGENVSPPLQWMNAPHGTQSFALLMFDQEGRKGLGVTHWVAYGIPANRTVLTEGEAQMQQTAFVSGKNITGSPGYIGPCPPFGDAPHHYVFTLIATDLAPQALQPGLSLEALLAALDKHALGATSLVGRYGH